MRFHPEQLGFTHVLPQKTVQQTWVKNVGPYRFRMVRSELYMERPPEHREHDHWLDYALWEPENNAFGANRELNLIVREAEFKDVATWGVGYMMPRKCFLVYDLKQLTAHDFFVAHAADEYRKHKIEQLLK